MVSVGGVGGVDRANGTDEADGVDSIIIGRGNGIASWYFGSLEECTSFLILLVCSSCCIFPLFCHHFVDLEVPVYTVLRLLAASLCQRRALLINLFPTISTSLNSFFS